MIMGWGAQYDNNHAVPTSFLQFLSADTIDCPAEYQGEWGRRDYQRAFPKFICIAGLPNIGGPCDGDEGGTPQPMCIRMYTHT